MKGIEAKFRRIIFIVLILFITIFFTGIAALGQQRWIEQGNNTTAFETCMEQATFKSFNYEADPVNSLSPEELKRHFANFDEIFKTTGLPPIWNGSELVPWKIYHEKSIIEASQCHKKLGITNPQKQLRGTYSKAVWDPNSNIWSK